ncbi:Beta-1,3-glucan-binding protein [Eumeta japonica]|uniref:Beta-1,3-glucan-binding protein n=1 Tax=Eumeta variegata TaxID=151549 RepID=A0A4C1YF44_EUMVA|nr:Beta-1,3-glucan-binding protein [Eumeta japonica]
MSEATADCALASHRSEAGRGGFDLSVAKDFYIIMNLAVGGTNGFFPDGVSNPSPKPWWNGSPTAPLDFWNAQGAWLPTWNLNVNDGQDASLQVDYVRVWAL